MLLLQSCTYNKMFIKQNQTLCSKDKDSSAYLSKEQMSMKFFVCVCDLHKKSKM